MCDRAKELIHAYGLARHPEGGWFCESYTHPKADSAGRSLMGSIYFLLAGGELSHLHAIDCEELWYYHEGCGMRLTLIDAAGNVTYALLGPDAAAGQRMMVAIPQGVWFAAENLDAGSYTFVSCPTAPKFRYEGFSLIDRAQLRARCPGACEELAYLVLE